MIYINDRKSLPKLVKLARVAARAAGKANAANRAWRDAFSLQFGHDDISDVLVEMIDYACEGSDGSGITAEVILENSEKGQS